MFNCSLIDGLTRLKKILWYSHLRLHCSLCKECWSTINKFTCYTEQGPGIYPGACIVLFVARNYAVPYIPLLRLGRLWYSHSGCIVLYVARNSAVQCTQLLHLSRLFTGGSSVCTQDIGVQCTQLLHLGWLWYSPSCVHCSLCSKELALNCYTLAGSGIHKGDCIVICVARNAGVQYVYRDVYLLHLGRLWYSHRWPDCSLCSQECCSTMHSTATPEQALVFAQVD